MMRTQISLTEYDRHLLDTEAIRTGWSISALIRAAIERSYGVQRAAAEDLNAISAAAGAWAERDFDGESYVEGLRSGIRLREAGTR